MGVVVRAAELPLPACTARRLRPGGGGERGAAWRRSAGGMSLLRLRAALLGPARLRGAGEGPGPGPGRGPGPEPERGGAWGPAFQPPGRSWACGVSEA